MYGKAYQILIKYPRRALVLYFKTAQEALDCYGYLLHCRETIHQVKYTLFERIRFNVDVVFNPSKFIYHGDLLTKILMRMNETDIDEGTVYKNIELKNVTNTLYKILIGFFSFRKKNLNDVETIISFFNEFFLESVRKKIKAAEEGTAFVIKTILVRITGHQKVLDTFNIEDKRFKFVFESLVNVYKKLFFNSTSKILNNIVDKLSDREYLKDADGKDSYILYIDFFKELKNFITEFEILKSYKGCSVIVVEFLRKQLYLFIGHLNRAFKEDIYDITLEEQYILLEGIFYFNRETGKLYSFLQNIFDNFDLPPQTIKFKKSIFILGDIILNKVMLEVDKEIDGLEKFDPKSFEIEFFVKSRLPETHARLERLHNYYAVKILKHIYVRLLCRFILETAEMSSSWIKNELKEKIIEIKEFFDGNIRGHNMEHFSRFLDFYKSLIFTTSLDKGNMIIAMMVNVLGERLEENVINAMIKTRVNDTFGIQSFRLKNLHSDIKKQQKIGDNKMQAKQNHRKRVAHLTNVFFVVIRFVGKIRNKYRISKRNFSLQRIEKIKENKNFYGIDKQLEDSFKVMFIRRPAFAKQSDGETMAEVKSVYTKSVLFKYSLVVRNDEFFLLDDKSSVVRMFFLTKFAEMQKGTINQEPLLLVGYGLYEKLLFVSSKPEKIDRLFKFFLDVMNKTKEIKFNSKRFSYKNRSCQ